MEPQMVDYYNETPHMFHIVETMNQELIDEQEKQKQLQKQIKVLQKKYEELNIKYQNNKVVIQNVKSTIDNIFGKDNVS